MKLANKILLGGLLLASAVYGGGFWNQHRLENRLLALVASCKQPDAKATAAPPLPPGYTLDAPPSGGDKKFDLATARPITADDVLGVAPLRPESGPWEKYKADPLLCDPVTLVELQSNVGIQAQITEAYYASRNATTDANVLALCVAILSVVPWLWYFLLRRIVELRNAIGGKLPPD